MAANLNGPLTGWTANLLTPIAKIVAPQPVPLSPMQEAHKKEVKAANEVRKVAAEKAEAEAQASGDPGKLRQAWELLKRTSFDQEGTGEVGGLAGATQEEQHKMAVAFKKRNPTFDFGSSGGTSGTIDKLIFEAPSGQVRSYVSQNLFNQTGLGTGKQLDTDVVNVPFGNPASPLRPSAAGQPDVIDPSIANVTGAPQPSTRQSEVIGGAGPAFVPGQVTGAAGGPSFSGPTSGWTSLPGTEGAPAIAFSAPPTPQAPSSASPTDAYNLTPEELGSNIPNPRANVAPTTALEGLLHSIYPDAPVTGADPLADARNPGAAPSGFNDVIAYLTKQSSGGGGSSGYVPAPQMAAGNGAQIASTIPGAPAWLGGQINNLSSGGGFVQAPVSGAGAGNTLAGLAAISAEQRMQQAQLDAEAKRKQIEYQAMLAAKVESQRRAAQIASFQPTGWSNTNPVVANGWNASPMIVNGIQVGQRPY